MYTQTHCTTETGPFIYWDVKYGSLITITNVVTK